MGKGGERHYCLQPTESNCKTISYTDSQSIEIIKKAVDKAKEIPGNLNYVVEFNMTITYSNQTVQVYHLSLGATEA